MKLNELLLSGAKLVCREDWEDSMAHLRFISDVAFGPKRFHVESKSIIPAGHQLDLGISSVSVDAALRIWGNDDKWVEWSHGYARSRQEPGSR